VGAYEVILTIGIPKYAF